MNELEEARRIIAAADADIARLFEKRMEAVRRVAGWKRERGLPVYDPAREEELIRKNAPLIADPDLREYYARFQRDTMAVSRAYQECLIFDAEHGGETGDGGTVLHLNLRGGSYPVVLGSGTLAAQAKDVFKSLTCFSQDFRTQLFCRTLEIMHVFCALRTVSVFVLYICEAFQFA